MEWTKHKPKYQESISEFNAGMSGGYKFHKSLKAQRRVLLAGLFLKDRRVGRNHLELRSIGEIWIESV